ncbi:MAG: PAS domain S-box protein [Candidatus Methanofastidiosum sp.]|nr:PAS domain S-box protein [Methanofastidiosum sp.]
MKYLALLFIFLVLFSLCGTQIIRGEENDIGNKLISKGGKLSLVTLFDFYFDYGTYEPIPTYTNIKGDLNLDLENVEKLFGYNVEDFTFGKVSFSGCIHPDDLKRVANEVEKYSNEKGIIEFIHDPYRIITKDGVIKFVSDWTFIVRNLEGNITHYKGIVEDITERKKAEDRLKSTNKQLEDIIEFLPDATFIIDNDKKIIAWNRAMEQMTGIPKIEILGKDRSYGAVPFYGRQRPYLIDLIFKPDSDISSKYDFVKRKGKALYVEVFTPAIYNGKGAYMWAIASPLFDAEGNVIGAIESIRDINEFKTTEKALRESEEKYRTLFEDSKNPIWTTSQEGIILDANQAAAELLGYTKDELIGIDVNYLYVDPNHRRIFQAEIEEKGFVKNFQSQWKTKDGRQLDLLFDFTLWKGSDGNIIGYRGIAEDVTLINRSQKQLGENLEYFAHLVDHIRNPLTIICGFAQVEIENEKTKNRFLKQIARIEEIIKQLDQGWMDTEDTRRFMKRYM